jgi:hypothetical protein
MALHEGMEPKRHGEHARKEMHPAHKARKRGGEVEADEKDEPEDEDQDEETRAEEREAGPHESPGRKHGGEMPEHKGRQRRKAGGAVKGEKPKHRPDRRARGGGTADLHPETAAGHMSTLPFERVGSKPDGGGHGKDRDPD